MNTHLTINDVSPIKVAGIGWVLGMSDNAIIQMIAGPAPAAPAAASPDAEQPAAPVEQAAPAKKRTAAKPAAEAPAPAAEPEAPAAEPEAPATDVVVITLEEVRAALAGLSKAGKAPQAKAIIAASGADKLTDVDPSKYAQIMAAVAQEVA